jgi:aldose 1-epimerase
MRCALPALLITVGLMSAALAQPPAKTGPAFEQEPFGKIPASKNAKGMDIPAATVTEYTLINKNGVVLKCIDYGTIITELHVPDKTGKMADVVLGFDKLDGYLKGHPYFGATAGRCANRIANAKFTLDGKEFTVTKPDDGPHTLHGGKSGFDKKLWKGSPFLSTTGPGVKFTYRELHIERQQRTRHRLPGHHRQDHGLQPGPPQLL